VSISIVNGNRGTATEKTSDQTLTLTPSGTLAVENYGLLCVVIDNTGAGEGQTTDVSVTDTKSNVWEKLREQTESNTTALTGVTVALFLAKLRYAIGATDTISIALAANSTGKAAGLAELSVAAGNQLIESISGDNGSNGAAATSYSVALSALTNVPGLYVGVAAAEEEVDAAVTLDASYAEIGFGSIGSGTGGLGTSNVRARVGTLANTSTGDTFDAAALTSAERATILVRLEEYAPPFVANPVLAYFTRDASDALFHRQQRRPNSSLLYPPVVVDSSEPAFPLRTVMVRRNPVFVRVGSFLTAFDETTVPPEPPPPPVLPDYPTSPPPPRLGGGSAW
jgi:hypothetical protein